LKPIYIVYLLLLTSMSSCIQGRKIAYFDSKVYQDSVFVSHRQLEYKLRIGDVLKVDIIGLDPNITALFKTIDQQSNAFNQNNPASILLEGHMIDQRGDINLPLIGAIAIADLTIDMAADSIQSRVDEYFINAEAKVSLVSFRVTILGEVKNPGMYYNYNKELTLLEGLGLAGDLTDVGDREHVRLIRPKDTGEEVINLDLSDQDVIKSPYYHLSPGDVIYIPPVGGQTKRINIPVLTLFFAGVTTAFLMLNYFK
jgi:polysaccharide export outer membrane protein